MSTQRTAGPLGSAIGITAALAATNVAVAGSTLLHCTMQRAAGLGIDGELVSTSPATDIAKLLWGDFVVDLSTGAVHMKGSKPRGYTVVQHGEVSNDTVLVPTTIGPVDPATAATDFLRVRQWSARPLFIAFDLDIVTTGICDPVD